MMGRWYGSAIGVAVLTGLLAAVSGAGATSSTWTVVPTPNPGSQQVSNVFFTGVSASSSTDAWGVGVDEINAFRSPLVEHWDGVKWTAVSVPAPSGRQSWLNGVTTLSPTNAWAVGESSSSGSQNQNVRTLIEHWNGTAWSIVPSPNPAQGQNDSDALDGISGVAANDLWAVGSEHDDAANENVLLFEHFDGTSWTVVKTPSPIGAEDFGYSVAAIASNDVWAVGTTALQSTLAAHWDGTRWTIVPTPSPRDGSNPLNFLTGVTAVASNDVWASGYEGNVSNTNFMQPYVLHWDGTSWTLSLVPNLGGEGSRLNAITALSGNDVWGVGQTQELDGSILTLTEQFDGTRWNVVPSPNPGTFGSLTVNALQAVGALGGGQLFALGDQENTGHCCQLTLAMETNPAGGATPPANTSPPTISGSAVQGQPLAADPGGWSGSPAPSFGYQWQRCDSAGLNCVGISGATGAVYTSTAADVGSTIGVTVTASNSAGSATAAAAPVGPITSAPASSGPQAPILDTFNRANGPLGANWATVYGGFLDFVVSANQIVSSSSGYAWDYWAAQQFGPDSEAYATIKGLSSDAVRVCARLVNPTSSARSGYCVQQAGSTWSIRRIDHGASTTLAQTSQPVTAGDRIGIIVNGSTIQAWYAPTNGSWTQLLTTTDTTYTQTGYLALETRTTPLDNFGGGTLG
jgi:hypothetical protein